ncbi:MAG: NgoMIV family type II restriction endonuclease [Pseudomonadota bacterium]
MEPWLAAARRMFHAACLSGPISETGGISSIADVDNKASREISAALIRKIGLAGHVSHKPSGQTAGAAFERVCMTFLADALKQLDHLRPGPLQVARGLSIVQFDQYAHLEELRALANASRELKTLLGTDYLIKPDIVVIRPAQQDAQINRDAFLVDASVASLSALRVANGARATLHASISCKLTIRSDRVQNTRSEALNLIRNRKGRLPHIAAVTAEPTPTRIAAIALGTGDIDCVYHFALPELVQVLRDQERETLELVETMIDGQRLRDIADLPLDLVL